MRSSPGEEFDDLFFKILLIIAGVMADMSNRDISSNGGDGITSSTQEGR